MVELDKRKAHEMKRIVKARNKRRGGHIKRSHHEVTSGAREREG